ncbi:uncharacterized protein LOC135217255 [Macrobrachium nipponense]|uniref:uncharacterized protein LOC135217255 n=1 Tax=Macrobrachium nipponense TaxID=159736 RepID=UPI0030C869E1
MVQPLGKGSSLVTMAPYTPSNPNQYSLGLRRKSLNKKKNRKLRSIEVMPEEGNIEDSDILEIYREIITCLGRKPKISSLGKGHLLIEVQSPSESSKLKEIETISGNKIKCEPHKTYNQSRGVIFSKALMKFSEDKLLKKFVKDQNVTEVKRIMKKEHGVLCPQPLLILTFDSLKLPEILSVAWYQFKVRPYIPSPRQCFHCQMYGHVNTSCRRKAKGEVEICVNCGQESHGPCSNAPKCVNCGGEHPASDKKCERYLFEKEIMAVKTKERISFFEAKQKVASSFNPGICTFAAVTKRREMEKNSLNNNSNPRIQLNKRSRSDDCIILPDSKNRNSRGDSFKTHLRSIEFSRGTKFFHPRWTFDSISNIVRTANGSLTIYL